MKRRAALLFLNMNICAEINGVPSSRSSHPYPENRPTAADDVLSFPSRVVDAESHNARVFAQCIV